MSIISINSWQDFAEHTVLTGDLDPMYDMIYKLDEGERERYALHFFMFYDAGEAAKAMYATDENTFWEYVQDTYDTTKRGTERRHFRGDKGRDAIYRMKRHGNPIQFWDRMHAPTLKELTWRVVTRFKGCQIGPYFIWKAMDLLDRCLERPVQINMEAVLKGMPDEPRKCADTVFPGWTLTQAVQEVTKAIEHLPAAGARNRLCGYPEAETILCMIKGYFVTGTHTLGDDVDEKHEQMKDFPEMCRFLPPKQDWSKYVKSNTLVTPFVPA